MHPVLAKRIEIPWPRVPWARVSKAVPILFSVVAIVISLYVLSAPPIIKIIWKVQIRQGQHVRWPRLYAPLLLGLESDSPVIHGSFKWYFNDVWGCGIIFFDDIPSGKTD
jgi:hypothetical protein